MSDVLLDRRIANLRSAIAVHQKLIAEWQRQLDDSLLEHVNRILDAKKPIPKDT